PCDFFLFPKLKLSLRGRYFESLEVINQNSLNELKATPGISVLQAMGIILRTNRTVFLKAV
ncbi:hypothetical protein WH47_00007, partial [Habropoda laboriosa]